MNPILVAYIGVGIIAVIVLTIVSIPVGAIAFAVFATLAFSAWIAVRED